MLAALALSQAVAAADQGAPTPALVPSAERVSTVDGIDRLKAWMAAKKTNSSSVNLRAEEPQAARQPRSLAQVMKAIAESHRSTHAARRIATERADARLADERSWQPAYDRPWHAAKEEAVRKLTRKASATAAGLAKRVALPSEVAHSQDQMEPAEASEYDGTLADEAASPVDAELRLLRAAELVHGGEEKEDDSEDAAVSFLQFQFETGDDETSLKAEGSGGAMKKLKKKYKAQTKIAEAHERIDDMKEAKKKLKKKEKADEKKEDAEERKEAAHERKIEAEQGEEGSGEESSSETGDDETSLKAQGSEGAMKKLKKKYKAQTKIAEAHERIDDMKEAKKKLKKKEKADEKKEDAEERKEAAHERKAEAEQEEEGSGEESTHSEQSAGADHSAVSDASVDRVAARKAEKEKQMQQRQAQKDVQKAQAEARAQQKKDAKEADRQRKEALKASKEALKVAKASGAEGEGSRMAR